MSRIRPVLDKLLLLKEYRECHRFRMLKGLALIFQVRRL